MARHEFEPTRYHNALGTAEPALTIADGDTVVAQTIDAWGIDRHGKQVASRPNPMTGPFFVAGAEPGDTLMVSIDSMTMTRDTGWTYDAGGAERGRSRRGGGDAGAHAGDLDDRPGGGPGAAGRAAGALQRLVGAARAR